MKACRLKKGRRSNLFRKTNNDIGYFRFANKKVLILNMLMLNWFSPYSTFVKYCLQFKGQCKSNPH